MRSCLEKSCGVSSVGLLLLLCFLSSGWTCSAVFSFDSCQNTVPRPVIVAVSPTSVSLGSTPTLLTVTGEAFVSQSRIVWNRGSLASTFVDSRHLQATITPETFDSFGGSAGTTVAISVLSPAGENLVVGCSNGGSSAVIMLQID